MREFRTTLKAEIGFGFNGSTPVQVTLQVLLQDDGTVDIYVDDLDERTVVSLSLGPAQGYSLAAVLNQT